MGDIIRKDAAADSIFSDVRTTAAKAFVVGGTIATLAHERLGPLIEVIDSVIARSTEADEAARPLAIAVEVEDARQARFIGRVADDVRNAVGRPGPGTDAGLALLFPGGISAYTDGPKDEEPDRMERLAELLEAGVHVRLDRKVAKRLAKEVRQGAAEYRKVLEKARPVRGRAELLKKVRIAIARHSQGELSNLKRLFKSNGITEARIHEVIPDRSRASAAKPSPAADSSSVTSPEPAHSSSITSHEPVHSQTVTTAEPAESPSVGPLSVGPQKQAPPISA